MFSPIPTRKLSYSLRSVYPLTALIQENMVHNDKIIKYKYRKSIPEVPKIKKIKKVAYASDWLKI